MRQKCEVNSAFFGVQEQQLFNKTYSWFLLKTENVPYIYDSNSI